MDKWTKVTAQKDALKSSTCGHWPESDISVSETQLQRACVLNRCALSSSTFTNIIIQITFLLICPFNVLFKCF